jgi:hypothetical protein
MMQLRDYSSVSPAVVFSFERSQEQSLALCVAALPGSVSPGVLEPHLGPGQRIDRGLFMSKTISRRQLYGVCIVVRFEFTAFYGHF